MKRADRMLEGFLVYALVGFCAALGVSLSITAVVFLWSPISRLASNLVA